MNIQNELIYFKDISYEQLPKILEWYNKVDDFKFATGIDTPITMEKLMQKYAEVAISSSEFFVGIYTVKNNRMIGILKGRLQNRSKDTLWISSIVIDPENQRVGYGKESIRLLLGYLERSNQVKDAYLAVIEDNTYGRLFWLKLNFNEIRKINNHLKFKDKNYNVIIMHKRLQPSFMEK